MTATSLPAIVIIFLKISPLTTHRLITSPYPEQEWDSVIVSSDPITIREKSHNVTAPLKHNEILRPQKRSYEECPENDFSCLYGTDDKTKHQNDQVVDKFLEKYSHIADVKYSDDGSFGVEKEGENPRKSYWMMVDSQTHNHPYDDSKGWVTLDPVPWSTSKISKWHPSKGGAPQQNKPWGYGSSTQRPQVQQFWVSGSTYQPQMPSSPWGIGTNDIITDNKPSNFPSGPHYGYGGVNQDPHHQSGGYPGNYNTFQQYQDVKGKHPSRFPQNTHPSTYPNNNDGEWVLLSTTKGYSHPQRHRWAGQKNLKVTELISTTGKVKPTDISKYHEEDLNEKFVVTGGTSEGNRKSDSSAVGDVSNETIAVSEKTPIQVLYTGSPKDEEAVKTFRRKVRLQVLPSLESSSTSYGGLLEVDSSSQTVDEAQQEDEKLQKLKAIANVKKNKIRGFKLVPASKVTGKGMSHKNVVTLAAVGAGMIPATMALLVPMALGRRRRSLSDGGVATWKETNELKRCPTGLLPGRTPFRLPEEPGQITGGQGVKQKRELASLLDLILKPSAI